MNMEVVMVILNLKTFIRQVIILCQQLFKHNNDYTATTALICASQV
jgi:hypothetical protein